MVDHDRRPYVFCGFESRGAAICKWGLWDDWGFMYTVLKTGLNVCMVLCTVLSYFKLFLVIDVVRSQSEA